MIVSRLLAHRADFQLPLFAMKIPAGPPTTAEDYIEDRIDISRYLAPHPETTFLVKVEGDSMIGAGINPGDMLVVERGAEPHNGDVVVALVSNQFTVKQFRDYRGNLFLVPANSAYPPPKPQDFSVWGVVRYSIHKL